MANRTNANRISANEVARKLSAAVSAQRVAIRRQARAACQFESLEARTLMSTVHLPVHSSESVLAVPASLTATANGPASVQLSWTDKDSSAGGYFVLRSDTGKTYSQIANINGGTAATYSDISAISGHTYRYEVQAYSGSNVSVVSKVASATTPLVAPSRLEAGVVSSSSVQLNWADNDTSATGYYVLRSTDNIHYAQVTKLTSGTAASYLDKSLSPKHTYYYEIQAFNLVATSPASAMASASTPLAVPSAVTAIASGANSIQVAWTDTDAAALGFYVLRATDGSHFSQVAQISSGKITTYTDSTASSNSSYQYEVQAYCVGNTSAISSPASATTPIGTPTSLNATALTGTSMQLGWTDTDSSATGYLVLRSGDGNTFSQIAKLNTGSAHSFTDGTVVSGQAYVYEVQAVTTTNSSAVSNKASASTPLAAPSGVGVTVQSSTSAQIVWTGNDTSATGYYVLRTSDGVHFSQVGKLTSGKAGVYVDTTLLPLHSYAFEVEAFTAAVTSAASDAASATTPLSVPGSLAAAVQGPTSIKLTWTDKDAAALGYYVFRSSGSGSLSKIAQLNSGSSTSFIDTTASSDTVYSYKVQAFNGVNTSDASTVALATTPLTAPSALSASAPNGSSVQLNWTDNDSTAAGYFVLRSTDGIHFAQTAKISVADANSYTDSTVSSGRVYQYEVQAFAGTNTSSTTNPVSVTTPLAAPSGLNTVALSGSSIQLTWVDHDASATGYYVLRSTDATHFSQVTKITTANATTYTDTSVASAHTYSYEIQAFDASTASAVSGMSTVSTVLNSPAGLTVTPAGAWVSLAWTNKDTLSTGYFILRSDDGVAFSQLTKITSPSTTTFSDTTVSSGHKYYYEVEATNDIVSSAASNMVNIVAPTAGNGGNITITTRYGNELVVTASGTGDSIAVSESGSTLTINADGQTYTQAAPTGDLVLYARGGADGISIDSSVTTRTIVEAIDGALTAINSAATNVSAWIDAADSFSGQGIVHAISSFAGGVSKALGAALVNPKDAGTTVKVNHSLWGAGPVAGDVNQGGVGDCYFLSTLAAFAGTKPSVLQESAVDMGDGTYAVQYYSQGQPVYVRVSNDFSTGYYGGGFQFAHPGTTGDIWAMVMEKAFAYFRTGANTYASINSGWMGSVYANLGVNSSNIFLSSYNSESAFYNMVSTDLANGEAVTFGTVNPQTLVSSHAYTLVSASIDVNGVTHYVVRNPWGISGDSLENSQGYATLTFAQMKANFYDGCQATG